MLNPHATELTFLTPVLANLMELVRTYTTTRNVPYVHLMLDSILELCQTFLIGKVRCVSSNHKQA